MLRALFTSLLVSSLFIIFAIPGCFHNCVSFGVSAFKLNKLCVLLAAFFVCAVAAAYIIQIRLLILDRPRFPGYTGFL